MIFFQIDVMTTDSLIGLVLALELFQLAWLGRLETRLSRIEGYLKGREVKKEKW